MLPVLADAAFKFAPAGLMISLILTLRPGAKFGVLALVSVLYLVDFALLRIPAWMPEAQLDGVHWNWAGKTASILFGLGVLTFLPRPLFEQVGLFRMPTWRQWVPICGILILYCGQAVLSADFGSPPFDRESVLFQATLPGIDEELSFRGYLWVLLADELDPHRVENGRIPWWTLIVITFLFGWVHGAGVDGAGVVYVNADKIIGPALGGVALGFLQGFGRAVWIPLLAHNFTNTIRYL